MASYRKVKDSHHPGSAKALQADSATALQGAALAFTSPSTPSGPASSTSNNGARIAASLAGHDQRILDHKNRQYDGGINSRQTRQRLSAVHGSSSGREPFSIREQSPSHIAAVIASSNSSPAQDFLSQSPPVPRRQSPLHCESQESTMSDWSTHGASIDPTSSLIRLYEQIEISKNKKTQPISRQVSDTTAAIISPTPIRTSSASLPLREAKDLRQPKLPARTQRSATPNSSIAGTFAAANNKLSRPHVVRSQTSTSVKRPAQNYQPPARSSKPTTLGVPSKYAYISVPPEFNASSMRSSYTSPLNEIKTRDKGDIGKPSESYVQGPSSNPMPGDSPNYGLSSQRPSYEAVRGFVKSVHSSVPREVTFSTTSLVPQLTADSLANAMVASSLASSRASSPLKAPLPPPRRYGKPHGFFYRGHSSNDVSRTPSPAKQMRQTLRTPRQLECEEDHYKKRRSHFMKKHPNKHHEGDRKRWRDTVSERERKRYEGIWAANKNILLPITDPPSDTVCNVVVRDIWHRSRLPDDILEEVWELVDTRSVGALAKEEFVVGMWLIDQRLKGRKLPAKVSESVWESVKMLSGIKMSKRRLR